jgi:hypothetical protein
MSFLILAKIDRTAGTAALTALLRLLFFVFFVNRDRIQVFIQIFCLEDLPAVQASDVLDTVPPVQKLGSLVLTTLHSEITPILDCAP